MNMRIPYIYVYVYTSSPWVRLRLIACLQCQPVTRIHTLWNQSKITSNKENPLGSPRNVKQSSWKCAENMFTMIGEYDASDMSSKCPAGGFSPWNSESHAIEEFDAFNVHTLIGPCKCRPFFWSVKLVWIVLLQDKTGDSNFKTLLKVFRNPKTTQRSSLDVLLSI